MQFCPELSLSDAVSPPSYPYRPTPRAKPSFGCPLLVFNPQLAVLGAVDL